MSVLQADKQTFYDVAVSICTLVFYQAHPEDTCRVSVTVHSSC